VDDPRVNAPTPNSPVEAYEEDWYRSLRALAERRRSEFERVEDDEHEEPADQSSNAGAQAPTHSPGDVWATPVRTDTPGTVSAIEPGSDRLGPDMPGGTYGTESDGSRNEDGKMASFVEAAAADAVDGPDTVTGPKPEAGVGPVPADATETGSAEVAEGGKNDVSNALGPTDDPWARALEPLGSIALGRLPHARQDVASASADPERALEAGPIAPETDDSGARPTVVTRPSAPGTSDETELNIPSTTDEPTNVIEAEPVDDAEMTPRPEETAVIEQAADWSDMTDFGSAGPVDSAASGERAPVDAPPTEAPRADAVHVEGQTPIGDRENAGSPTSTGGAIDLGSSPETRLGGDEAELAPPSPAADAPPMTRAAIDADSAETPGAQPPTGMDRPDVLSAALEAGVEVGGVGLFTDSEDVPHIADELRPVDAEPEASVKEGQAEEALPEPPPGLAEAGSRPEPETEPEPEPAGSSVTSRDPAERRTALLELAEREPSAAELDALAALILDPDAEIRRLAVETLSRTPARLDDAILKQALHDPADQVRAAGVRAAATRGIRDLPTLAPLVDARKWPETHRTVLGLLPNILGQAKLTAEALDPLLLAVAQMQPPPNESERDALSEIAASIGTTLLVDGLTLPDARRLGAVRLLTGDRSHAALRALAERAGDPLQEIREAALAAAGEMARTQTDATRAAGPPDTGALVADLNNPNPERVERAITALAGVDRPYMVAWCRERLALGDADSIATVALVTAGLELDEVGVDLLTCAASLPPERRRPVLEALARFPDPSTLATSLTLVPPNRRAEAVRLVWEVAGHQVLPELRSLLADPAVEVRIAVIDLARDADDRAYIEAVGRLVAADSSPEVRSAAVRAVAKIEAGFPRVIAALADPDPHVRAAAVESLPSTPASEVGPVLAHALTDVDERVRLAAIERLAGVSSSEPALAWSALRQCRVEERDELLEAFRRTNPDLIVQIALEHVFSPDQEDRALAVEMTGWGARQAAVESAIRALDDRVAEVRRAAVGALGRLRDGSAVAPLGKTLADPDAEVRVGAVRALGVIDDEGVLAFLVAALKDSDHRVREATSHVLTEWSSPAVAKRLAGVLAVPSLRDSAADLLRRIGPTSVELLIDVLIQGTRDIRQTIGPLLEQIVGIEEFVGRLDSFDPARRLRAIEALGAIAGPSAVDALVRLLSDPDERVRLRAAQLLGELGDPLAVDAVRRLIDDPVPEVALVARHAVEGNVDDRGEDV
jgi:HEAT repeat protein